MTAKRVFQNFMKKYVEKTAFENIHLPYARDATAFMGHNFLYCVRHNIAWKQIRESYNTIVSIKYFVFRHFRRRLVHIYRTVVAGR